MKKVRLTPKNIAIEARVSTATIRRWADSGKLPILGRSWWGTRIFPEESIEVAKKLAGTADRE